MEWYKDEYVISDDRNRVDIGKVAELLSDTYWAADRPPELVSKSIENSMCFSIFSHNKQIGFGRVVTDYAVFAWIADIIIHPDHRGKGLGKFLMSIIVEHPNIPKSLQLLKTKDAHSLYEKFGFRIDECMEKREINSSQL
ncbi:GNAT family N-acetyltransferase [candidate division KSB1 bacterium]|nr:GNAT family N-acetyltransferase [candidate division KSB1 bacterium]